MKSLKLLTICGATLMLVACTKDDVTTTASFEELKATQPTPVAFSTYMGDQAVTRAGVAGSISDIADLINKSGFGVFAYHTGSSTYATASTKTPNFMYNEHVTGAGSSAPYSWTYSPIKYWPNDFNGANGAVDNRTATGTTHNYLSFFAYAPYASPGTSESSGITGFSANGANGDPTVSYALQGSGENVDLLWGTFDGTTTNVNGANNAGVAVTGFTGINVNEDLEKQTTGGKIGFAFKHALAWVGGKLAGGGLTIDAIVDEDTPGVTPNALPADTRITVKEIKITPVAATGYPMNATGNFNLATGAWSNLAGSLSFTHVIKNTLDANAATPETAANNYWELASSISEPTTLTALTIGSGNSLAWQSPMVDGVTTSAVNVYKTDPYPMLFIPGSKPNLKFEVTYVVRTLDDKLAKKYSEIEQKISNTVGFANAVELGNRYNVKLHLGLTSIKFNVTSVDAWTANGTATEVNVPINVN